MEVSGARLRNSSRAGHRRGRSRGLLPSSRRSDRHVIICRMHVVGTSLLFLQNRTGSVAHGADLRVLAWHFRRRSRRQVRELQAHSVARSVRSRLVRGAQERRLVTWQLGPMERRDQLAGESAVRSSGPTHLSAATAPTWRVAPSGVATRQQIVGGLRVVLPDGFVDPRGRITPTRQAGRSPFCNAAHHESQGEVRCIDTFRRASPRCAFYADRARLHVL